MADLKAAVFASGTGSNFQALMDAPDLACEIVLLVCDQPEAGAIDLAEAYGVPVCLMERSAFPSKTAFEQAIVQYLKRYQVDWVFLAGYMRLISPELLAGWQRRIINIHPSLLPSFPGKDGIGDAFRAGVEQTGVTIHYVDSGIDTGDIIAREIVPIMSDDTQSLLKQRIQTVEHWLYPRVINRLISGERFN